MNMLNARLLEDGKVLLVRSHCTEHSFIEVDYFHSRIHFPGIKRIYMRE